MKLKTLSLRSAFLGTLIGAGSFSLMAAASADLKTDKQKASYGIGQQIGKGIKSQGLDIDASILTASISDALAGRKSKLTDGEIEEALGKLQEQMQQKMMEQAKKNEEAGQKFLEDHKKQSGIKVTKSGLQYKVIKEGKGESPKDGAKVKVHYRGTLTDGTEFDSSYKRDKPAVFPINGVIAGWTEALKMMKPGGKWELAIPSELAYGSRGRPGIPANSVLLFTVELIEVVKDQPVAAANPKK